MGFPGHFKISGHSGTEFKHRKAFEKIKAYRKQSNETKNHSGKTALKLPIKSSIPIDYQYAYQKNRNLKLFFKLPIFLVSILSIGFFIANIPKDLGNIYLPKDQELIDAKAKKEAIRLENLTYFYNSGYYHLKRNELEEAHRDFVEVLLKDEYNVDARVGLAETLIARCKQDCVLCEEVHLQLDFIDKMDYLDSWSLRYLRDQLYKAENGSIII